MLEDERGSGLLKRTTRGGFLELSSLRLRRDETRS